MTHANDDLKALIRTIPDFPKPGIMRASRLSIDRNVNRAPPKSRSASIIAIEVTNASSRPRGPDWSV